MKGKENVMQKKMKFIMKEIEGGKEYRIGRLSRKLQAVAAHMALCGMVEIQMDGHMMIVREIKK